MISTELAQLRRQSPASAGGPAPTSSTGGARPAGETESAPRSLVRRRGSRTANLQGILRAILQGSDDLEGKMASLRQRGKQRAVAKTGDPHVVVSGPAALLLGVADLLEEHDAS